MTETLESYIDFAREANHFQNQLDVEAAERRRIAGLNPLARAYYAIRDWWRDLVILDWPASSTPWYKMPGGFSAAFAPSLPESHPDALGYFARKRMIESDPLVIPGTDRPSRRESDDTWPGNED